ncbi:uncharacterized protein EI97DRAFT_19470 [Westerdykella ornata]|uniref:Uncharacterized protein n=1 Tax=Westerdykella ornata TaxID=318751 RepID=A0A6A6JXD5_WESOR|nr:uncharacterized protein EI97DRAFT_19470 [Westerdykella ornata]KAF2281067.1 hypothetical protein EI97DRAFT_19470 [Westerdykella ornata]
MSNHAQYQARHLTEGSPRRLCRFPSQLHARHRTVNDGGHSILQDMLAAIIVLRPLSAGAPTLRNFERRAGAKKKKFRLPVARPPLIVLAEVGNLPCAQPPSVSATRVRGNSPKHGSGPPTPSTDSSPSPPSWSPAPPSSSTILPTP